MRPERNYRSELGNQLKSGLVGGFNSSASDFLKIIKQITSGGGETATKKPLKNRRRSVGSGYEKNQAIVRRHRPDYLIPLFFCLILLTGLILIYSISPLRANAQNNALGEKIFSDNHYFVRHLISALIAVATFSVFSFVPIDLMRRYMVWILLAGFAAAIGLFLLSKIAPGSSLVQCSLGACRWLRLGPISIQVSEMLKFSLLVFFSFFWGYFMSTNSINSPVNIINSILITGLALFSVVVLQNDLGSGGAMLVMFMFMIWAAGIKKQYVMIVLVLILSLSSVVILSKPHRISRVKTYLSDIVTPIDKTEVNDQNRHIVQAKIAVGSGGLFGLGVGKSVQATGYLPEAINDSIFAIIGEVFGFVGTGLVISLYVLLLYRLLRASVYSHQPFNQLWFVGIFTWIFSHVFINIGSMTGIIPMTGITLPFLSYGGSSMLFMAAALGVAFNLSRYTAHTPLILTDKQKSR